MTTPNSPIPGTTSLTKDIETPPLYARRDFGLLFAAQPGG